MDEREPMTPAAEPPEPFVGSTGDARVDAALARLDELDEAAVHEHAAIYADVHSRLSAALADASSQTA